MKKLHEIIDTPEMITPEEIHLITNEYPMEGLIEEWDLLKEEDQLKVFMSLELEKKVNLINELSGSKQERLIEDLSAQHLKLLMEEMEPDDIVDMIQGVSPEIRKSVWDNLTDEVKRETLFLLRFDEDDAAGIMTPRYLAVRGDISVQQAIQFLRKSAEEAESLYNLYVVDPLQRLLGVVSIKDLLKSKDEEIIQDIMDRNFISVLEDTDQEEVAKTLETYDLPALPVLDKLGRLLGIITFDDIIDVIREEQTEDVYKMGAMAGSADPYMDSTIWHLIKKRVPWLIILLLVGTITTNVVHHYEEIIIGAAFLFIFMPVITQTGGNSGNQSSTLMIRGLATGELHFRNIVYIMLKEFAIGLLMGVITGGVIILRSFLLPPGLEIFYAFTIGISLVLVVLFSTIIGALAPLLIHRLGFDPTVMSGPLMATLIDVVGLTIYFEIAKAFLRL